MPDIVPQLCLFGKNHLKGCRGSCIVAELGYGPDGSNPDGNPGWIWVPAAFNVDAGNNDEFKARLLPEAVAADERALDGGCAQQEDANLGILRAPCVSASPRFAYSGYTSPSCARKASPPKPAARASQASRSVPGTG